MKINKVASSAFIATILSIALVVSGCSVYDTAVKTNNILNAIFQVALADLPAIEATGVIPPSADLAVHAFLGLGVQLSASTSKCLVAGNLAPNKKSAFLACYLAFSTDLKSSSELAALKILSPAAQHQIQIWIAAVDTAVTSIIVAFGGTVPASAVSASVVSSPDYKDFEKRVKAYAKAHPLKA